jgi:hypothetical protein
MSSCASWHEGGEGLESAYVVPAGCCLGYRARLGYLAEISAVLIWSVTRVTLLKLLEDVHIALDPASVETSVVSRAPAKGQ